MRCSGKFLFLFLCNSVCSYLRVVVRWLGWYDEVCTKSFSPFVFSYYFLLGFWLRSRGHQCRFWRHRAVRHLHRVVLVTWYGWYR